MKGNIPRTADGRALSRQEQLLLLLEQTCEPGEWYYVPRLTANYIDVGQAHFNIGSISGAGDRSALNALVRKGHAIFYKATGGYDITEDGRLRAQEIT